MRAHIEVALRWGDQDAYGHVNNVTFARLLEEARVRLFWLGAAAEDTGLEEHFRADDPAGVKMLLASQHIEFVRVLPYSERPVVVAAWVGRLGGSSLEVHYEVAEGAPGGEPGPVVARAISTVVIVDGESLKPVRLDGPARASIEDWQDEPLRLGRAR